MIQIAKLVTEVTADTKEFVHGMNQVKASAKNASESITQSFSAIKTLLTGAAAIGVTEALKSAYENVDKIVASSNKLDISAASFQGLSYAAKISNVDVGALEEGMAHLRRTIGEAVNGNEAAKSSFRALGLDARKLADMGLDKAYIQVGKAVTNFSDSTDQASASMAVFGRRGQEQLKLLRNDVEGLVNEAAKMGLALTPHDIEEFEKLDKQVKTLSYTIEGQLNKAFVALAPSISKAITLIGEFKDASKSTVAAVDNSDWFNAYIDKLSKGTAAIGRGIGDAVYTAQDLLGYSGDPTKFKSTNISSVPSVGGGATKPPAIIDASANAVAAAFKKVADSATQAALGLSSFKTEKLKDFLGIKEASGKDYLNSILAAKPQRVDEDFTRLAQEIRDMVESGQQGFGGSIQGKVAQLKEIANAPVGQYDGNTNSGQLAAVKGFEDLIKKVSKPQDVNVVVKFENGDFVAYTVQDNKFVKASQDIASAMVSKEAQASGGY